MVNNLLIRSYTLKKMEADLPLANKHRLWKPHSMLKQLVADGELDADFYRTVKVITILMRWSLGTTYMTETGRVVRSLHGLASGVAGHSAITTMVYGITLNCMRKYREQNGLDEDTYSVKYVKEYFGKFGFVMKEETMGVVHTSDQAEFCAFTMEPWIEVERVLGHPLLYPDELGGGRVVFPVHNAKRALFALLFPRQTAMDKEDHRRLRCLQALLLGGFTEPGFRQALLEVIARKGGVFALEQVNEELVESELGFEEYTVLQRTRTTAAFIQNPSVWTFILAHHPRLTKKHLADMGIPQSLETIYTLLPSQYMGKMPTVGAPAPSHSEDVPVDLGPPTKRSRW